MTNRRCEVGTSVFADDICETKRVKNAADAMAKLRMDDSIVTREMKKEGLGMNLDKTIHMIRLFGTGANLEMDEFIKQVREGKRGQVRPVERYLGNLRHYDGHAKMNVDRRMHLAKEYYYHMKNLWNTSQVRWKIKKMIFNSIVLGTLLSGMEAEVPRKADVERMQVFILKMMRKALRQRGTRLMEDGSRRILKNEEIMTLFGTYTIESLLKVRRLKWYCAMLKHPMEHVQLRTALVGRMEFAPEGYAPNLSPWIEQLVKDLEVLPESLCMIGGVRAYLEDGSEQDCSILC
jgi:hypothetical protein